MKIHRYAVLILVVVFLLHIKPCKEVPVSVTFNSPSGAQYVKWSAASLSGVVGLTAKTVSFWYYHAAAPSNDYGVLWAIYDGAGSDSDEYNYLLISKTLPLKLRANFHFSNTDGEWETTNNVLTYGAWHHIVLTYNGASTTNNPIIYINGTSVSVTKNVTPSGTYRSGTATDFYLSTPTIGYAPNGKIADFRIYNLVITSAQVSALYAAGVFSPSFDANLVFNAPLTNCTTLSGSAFDGFTLTSSQKLIDRMNCAEGTPSGSPLGSDTNPT